MSDLNKRFIFQAHLKATRAIVTPKLLKELAKTNFIDLDKKISSHSDNFKNH